MDHLNVSMDVLRRLAKDPDNPDCVVLAEQTINDYLRNEIEALRAALERIGKAIDEEAAKVSRRRLEPDGGLRSGVS